MATTIPQKCDVVVIGGGPAGSIAACLLVKQGFEVVVLEKQRFPRPTVGESVIPHFWRFTDLIGASEAIEQEGFLRKKGGIVGWNDRYRKISFKNFGVTRPALHVERDIFDQILINQVRSLGGQVQEEVKVIGAKLRPDGWTNVRFQTKEKGEASIKCRYVIDASGQQAVLMEERNERVFDKGFSFQAFWGYFDKSNYLDQNVTIQNFDSRFDKPPMTFVTETGEWGWCWHILLREKVSVGVILPKRKIASFKLGGETLAERFYNFTRTVPLLKDLLMPGALIPNSVRSIRDYAYKAKQLTFDNNFLVGDAAAFVDPISSEGVPMAMYSAYLAAWAVESSLKQPARKDYFQQVFQKQYEMRLALFKLISFPGTDFPPSLFAKAQKAMDTLSETELHLIRAQSLSTGRLDNFGKVFGKYLTDSDVLGIEDVTDFFLGKPKVV